MQLKLISIYGPGSSIFYKLYQMKQQQASITVEVFGLYSTKLTCTDYFAPKVMYHMHYTHNTKNAARRSDAESAYGDRQSDAKNL